jgi:diacylglycerol kinase family enzyme
MATSLRENSPGVKSFARGRVALVLNENAGGVLAGGVSAESVAAALREGGFTVETPAPGPLPDRIQAAMDGAAVVVVAGGDGTAACAGGRLAGTGVALGLLPCGTMNLLAKDLRLPIGDPAAGAQVVLHGEPRAIDVGLAGDQVFLCACMMGTPARLARHREQARHRGRWGQWLGFGRAALKALLTRTPLRLVLTVDGVRTKLRTSSLTITVNRLDDRTGRLFGRSRLDGGELCAYALRRRSTLDLIGLLVTMLRGKTPDRGIDFFSGQTMSVRAVDAALRVLVDGEEHLMPSPVSFSVRPGALTVLAPAVNAEGAA